MYTLVKFYQAIGFTMPQIKAFVILPKITGTLSVLGSSYIIYDVLKDPSKRKKQYHQIMLGMSTLELISSFFGPFLGTWPMPKGYHLYAMGTMTTCDISAFLHLLGSIGAPLCNCSLITYYYLVIKHNWNDSRIGEVSKWFHIIPWSICTIFTIIGIPLKVFGPFSMNCW